MTDQNIEEQYCRIIIKLREHGLSLRTIAKLLGMSKSTLHRQMSAIEAIAGMSRLGQTP